MPQLKMQFLNTWAGCVWNNGLKDYLLASVLEGTHIFGLQEVHFNTERQREAFVQPENPGHRVGPILTSQLNELQEMFSGTYRIFFAEYAYRCLHDVERINESVYPGNAILIRYDLPIVGYRSAMMYGQFDQINDGRSHYCARTIQGVIVWFNNQPYLIFNIHGIWTGNGKADCSERTKQTASVSNFMQEMFDQSCRDTGLVPKIILGGDFNLTSDTEAFRGLLRGKVFGDGGAINLNNQFGVKNTRTHLYPADKKVLEADYILVSRNTKVYTFSAPAEPAVSDHRPLILECD